MAWLEVVKAYEDRNGVRVLVYYARGDYWRLDPGPWRKVPRARVRQLLAELYAMCGSVESRPVRTELGPGTRWEC